MFKKQQQKHFHWYCHLTENKYSEAMGNPMLCGPEPQNSNSPGYGHYPQSRSPLGCWRCPAWGQPVVALWQSPGSISGMVGTMWIWTPALHLEPVPN